MKLEDSKGKQKKDQRKHASKISTELNKYFQNNNGFTRQQNNIWNRMPVDGYTRAIES